MSHDTTQLLRRAVNDIAFRHQLRDQIEAALDTYQLTHEQREALIAGDERLLGLLGEAFWQAEGHVSEATPTPSAPPPDGLPPLTGFTLYLTLTPHLTQSNDGVVRLQHATSIAAVPPDPSAPAVALPDAVSLPNVTMTPLTVALVIRPTLKHNGEGWMGGYLSHIRPAQSETTFHKEGAASCLAPLAQADITIVGLGVMRVDQVTKETERAISESNRVLYVDTGVATQEYLEDLTGHAVNLYTETYSEGGERIETYRRVAERVVQEATQNAPITFALPGHPSIYARAPALVQSLAAERGLTVRVLPGISALDTMICDLNIDIGRSGLQMFDATELVLSGRPLQPDIPAIVWQVGVFGTDHYSNRRADSTRLQPLCDHLLHFHGPAHVVTAIFSAPHPMMRPSIISFPLSELSQHAPELHPGYSLFLPGV